MAPMDRILLLVTLALIVPFSVAQPLSAQQADRWVVGIYLVFATLILPALAVRKLPAGKRLLAGYLSAVTGYVLGLLASAAFDLPTGPASAPPLQQANSSPVRYLWHDQLKGNRHLERDGVALVLTVRM